MEKMEINMENIKETGNNLQNINLMDVDHTIEELKFFINQSVTPFHTVSAVKELFDANGFKEITMAGEYDIAPGGKYYINVYDSSMLAFTVGTDVSRSDSKKCILRCTSSHTDFPGFKLKPNAKICMAGDNGDCYVKLNTEVYGGPILNTWLDRPLSIGGRLVIKGEDAFNAGHVLVNADRPVMVIPNLAIHMNRDVNKGVELNRQKDMLPLTAILTEGGADDKQGVSDLDIRLKESDIVLDILLRDELIKKGIAKADVLDYELYIYSCDKGERIGISGEMFSSPRLDNLTSVFAQTKAIINAKRDNGINVAVYYDNEEIGSRTKQGAASQTIMLILEKIYRKLGFDRERLIDDVFNGMMLSCDVAHAAHPNFPEKSDPTNHIMLNRGIVIKQAANQSYSNDAYGTAVVRQICEQNQIDYQIFVNKSDMAGGQTLGAISSTVMPFRTIDIGLPLLAMHSARELMGSADQKKLEKFLTGYYS